MISQRRGPVRDLSPQELNLSVIGPRSLALPAVSSNFGVSSCQLVTTINWEVNYSFCETTVLVFTIPTLM